MFIRYLVLNKQLKACRIPSREAICKQHLKKLVDVVSKVAVDHDQLDPMVADISEKLDSMDREELIKRFVSLEFNRVLTVTIKVAPGYSSPNRPKQGGMRNHKRRKAA